MKKLRIGVVGLGGIAQKAWLPVLAAASDWTLQGAWSPTRAKALPICESWRIPYADSLSSLAASCDAVFVHSSTASHFDVVSTLLNAGVHVCVDKPLAENLRDAERLVELAARKKLTLMVGFNRRFAPLYGELKTQLATAASLRIRGICGLCQYRRFQPRTAEDKRRERLQTGCCKIYYFGRNAGILRKELEIHGIRQRIA